MLVLLSSRLEELLAFFFNSCDSSCDIMPKRIHSSGRKIVLTVRDFCEREKDNNAPLIPFGNVR